MMARSTSRTLVRAAALAGAALAMAACTDDAPPPTDAEYQEVAQAIGATTSQLGDGAALTVATQLATGVVPIGLRLDGTGRFSGDHFGLTYDYDVQCRTVLLEPVSCGALADTAVVDATWRGQLALPRWQASASHTGTWNLRGLSGAVTTVDGDARFALVAAFASASAQNTKTLDLRYDAGYDGVEIDNATHALVGGSIHYAIEVTTTHTTPGRDAPTHHTIDAVVTFTGGGAATLVLDGDRRFTIDLYAGVTVAAP